MLGCILGVVQRFAKLVLMHQSMTPSLESCDVESKDDQSSGGAPARGRNGRSMIKSLNRKVVLID